MKKTKHPITEKMLKACQQELKVLNMDWTVLLVQQILADKTIDKKFKKVDVTKVYNVFNFRVKDGAWILLMYKQAGILKEKLQSEIAATLN